MRRSILLHAFAMSALLAGCRDGELADGVSDSTFVRTMVELRRVNRRPALDSAQRAAARDSVLQGQGLTAERLEAAARALADDPERAAAVWRTIDERLARD